MTSKWDLPRPPRVYNERCIKGVWGSISGLVVSGRSWRRTVPGTRQEQSVLVRGEETSMLRGQAINYNLIYLILKMGDCADLI